MHVLHAVKHLPACAPDAALHTAANTSRKPLLVLFMRGCMHLQTQESCVQGLLEASVQLLCRPLPQHGLQGNSSRRLSTEKGRLPMAG